MSTLMTKQIAWGTVIGIAALGAGRAGAQTLAPAVAPRVAVVTQTQTPPTPPTVAIPVMPALAPMGPMELLSSMPPLPALPPMPALPLLSPGFADGFRGFAPFALAGEQSADDLYENARGLIEEGKYERALNLLNRLIGMNSTRTDAALYWKIYSLAKVGQRADALTAVADLEKRFKDSGWVKAAKAMEVELRQASGQPVSPEDQSDEELKLYALRGLMQNDPERALPMIEKLLSGSSLIKVKEQALFLLSQTRSARAREIIAGIAKGSSNPDLQLRAIRYIGMMGGDSRQILDDAYRATSDPAVKRAILRSFMTSGDRARLLALAKTEKDEALRAEAVRQLGVMHASAELAELYQSESSPEVKKQILQAMYVGGQLEKLIELAKMEKDPELRKTAIRNLGLMRRTESSDALASIYGSDANVEVRKAVINALYLQSNAKTLVDLARAEKNIELKKDIVSKLSNMKSKEATDYLLELLK